MAGKILAAHEMLDSMGVDHQFGGAIALAWYRNPRATTDIDLNVTVPPELAAPILGALSHLGVSVTKQDRRRIERDGQARLEWDGTYLDLFFATLDLHQDFARSARRVEFGPDVIPILSADHLVMCKAVFDRPKDWVDIAAMVEWGTELDRNQILHWVAELLGSDSDQYRRLADLLGSS
jgi:hypothetical protein